MNLVETLHHNFIHFLTHTFALNAAQANECSFELNVDENKQQFGDIATNAAMLLAKQLKRSPRNIAHEIVHNFTDDAIKKIEIAGPGFINIWLKQELFDALAQNIFEQKNDFFKDTTIAPKRYNIEFVSANPTGPLHFGHGRGGIIGDVLGTVLRFLGHSVTKEFYSNDAGSQIDKLGVSLKIRYVQALGDSISLPEDAYHGTYLAALAGELVQKDGKALRDKSDQFFGDYAKKRLLETIQKTLALYGISFDVWFSEKELHTSGAIESALALLKKHGHLYTNEGALWFKSTAFNDDKDRVLRKKSGELTYASADVAYMQDKVNRGHDHLIYILGHDHHSYLHRLHAMRKALGVNAPLDVILYQLVKIKDSGQNVKMSKRAGKIVSLNDIIETVGKDVARFFYLNRKADAQLEFDLDLALTQTDENPVYYIQYAYVRTKSILTKAQRESTLDTISAHNLSDLTARDDLLIKKIVVLKETLETIARTHQTHLLAYYTFELAQLFNRYYAKNRVIDLHNISLTKARLALIIIVQRTLSLCLDLLGISKPEKM